MKTIIIFCTLIGIISCSQIKKVTQDVNGETFRWVPEGRNEFGEKCEIKFLSEGRYTYSCRIHHAVTTVEGTWKTDMKNNTILLNLSRVDILPTYPEVFYKRQDTLFILSDGNLKHNNKIFKIVKPSKDDEGIKKGEVSKRLKIITIDSTEGFYIFNSKNENEEEVVVLSERTDIENCYTNPLYIHSDSVKHTNVIIPKNSKEIISYDQIYLSGKRIRNGGQMLNVIKNCNSFVSNK